MLRERTDRELAAWVRSLANELLAIDPSRGLIADAVDNAVGKLLQATDIHTVKQALEGILSTLSTPIADSAADDYTYFTLATDTTEAVLEVSRRIRISPILQAAVDREVANLTFLAEVMQMCESYRRDGRTPFSSSDDTALRQAYAMLDGFGRLPPAYSYIRTDELRPFQTYLSFADPGDGHLAVTVRDAEMLKGLVVHIEHIDRENVLDPKIIEPYRMPPIRTAAHVRLHVGLTTPCTAFIGRPVLEGGDYNKGRLKAVHTLAGACSAMFALGVAECKIGMDNLTAKQAIDFMQVVAGNVHRDPERQRLSAAFNINTPLRDDRKPDDVMIEARTEIARLAIDLTVAGHFDKVTWDGANNERSIPILGDQLTSEQLLHLVHRAHERGLETYISAGMLPEHMYSATLVGVGGVGIGLKLHDLDSRNRPGAIDPEKVKRALRNRNEAAETIVGHAARELARLDWDYSRGFVTGELNQLRGNLYETLRGWHSVAKPASSPGGISPDTSNSALPPLSTRLQDLVATIRDQYPTKESALQPFSESRSKGHAAVTPGRVDPGPLELFALRAIDRPGIDHAALQQALGAEDWDRIRRLLSDLAPKSDA